MYTFLLSEFIRLSKFELERELPQTTDQLKVFSFVSRLWYKVSSVDGRRSTIYKLRKKNYKLREKKYKNDVIISQMRYNDRYM